MVTAELSLARNNEVVWTDRLNGEVDDLLRPESELADRVARAVHLAVFDAEVEHILTQPLPTLESYSLLLGSIKLMHRSSKDEFLQTRQILDELINRHNRIAAPRAWLGNWFILRVTRGWSEDRTREAAEALEHYTCSPRPGSVGRARAGDRRLRLLSPVEGPRHRTQALQCGRGGQSQPRSGLALPRHRQRVQGRRGSGCGGDATRDGPVAARSAAVLLRIPRRNGTAFRATIRGSRKACALFAHAQSNAPVDMADADRSRWSVKIAWRRRAPRLPRMRELEPTLTVERYLARMPNAPLEIGRHWARCLALAGLPTGNGNSLRH